MAEVRFEHVTKRFGDTVAIHDLNLEIPDKEFLVLVGPSGCGKSTALRLLSGLEELTEGNIYIGEKLVNGVSPKDRDIAMVFQSYALYPHMSVYDNMAFGLSLRKTPKKEIERRVKEAARILGIEDLLKRKPRQLSGGQRQRVALGRAIVREPAAFLLDEPLSNLDAKLRVQTRAELSKLHQRLGTTFIYVTHDQVEAMTMATRIAVLSKGELQQVGAPQELYEKPANVFVAGFIGSPAMNFVEVTIGQDKDKTYLDAKDIHLAVPAENAAALAPYSGKRVIFGIRPEDIHVPEYLLPGIIAVPIRATVDVTELMGNELFLHLVTGGWEFLARVDARVRARPGQEIDLVLNMSKMHAFDSTTKARVL
jgi:multiple sugar transport system ATP-binding protein